MHLFKCPDGKEFIGWLERYTPQSKQKIEATRAGGKRSQELLPIDAIEAEVKAPGQGVWVRAADPKATAIMTPRCANGDPAPVMPGT